MGKEDWRCECQVQRPPFSSQHQWPLMAKAEMAICQGDHRKVQGTKWLSSNQLSLTCLLSLCALAAHQAWLLVVVIPNACFSQFLWVSLTLQPPWASVVFRGLIQDNTASSPFKFTTVTGTRSCYFTFYVWLYRFFYLLVTTYLN